MRRAESRLGGKGRDPRQIRLQGMRTQARDALTAPPPCPARTHWLCRHAISPSPERLALARVSKDGPRASWFETAQAPPHREGCRQARRRGSDVPDGQISGAIYRPPVQPLLQKYSDFPNTQI